MPLFGKKDSGKKVRKDPTKDIDKQIINIEDKYHLRQVLGKWVPINRHRIFGSINSTQMIAKKNKFSISLSFILSHHFLEEFSSLKPELLS